MKQSEKKPPRLKVFQERFDLLRKEHGSNNTDFAKFLDMSRQTVGFYLNGDRVPDALNLVKIAEKCNVSVDWLLGLSNEPSNDIDIKRACKFTGLNQKAIESLLEYKEKHPQIDVINYLFESKRLLVIIANYMADFTLSVLWEKPFSYIPLKPGSLYSYRHDVHLAMTIRALQVYGEKFKKLYKDNKEFITQSVYSFLLNHADIEECHRILGDDVCYDESFENLEEYEMDELDDLIDEEEWKMREKFEKDQYSQYREIEKFLRMFDTTK